MVGNGGSNDKPRQAGGTSTDDGGGGNDDIEKIIGIAVALVVVALLGVLCWKRQKDKGGPFCPKMSPSQRPSAGSNTKKKPERKADRIN